MLCYVLVEYFFVFLLQFFFQKGSFNFTYLLQQLVHNSNSLLFRQWDMLIYGKFKWIGFKHRHTCTVQICRSVINSMSLRNPNGLMEENRCFQQYCCKNTSKNCLSFKNTRTVNSYCVHININISFFLADCCFKFHLNSK